MPTNWPPAGAAVSPFQASGWDALLRLMDRLTQQGWTNRAPTNQERNSIFVPVRCDEGHTVSGRVIVAPAALGGQVYYVALCDVNHDPNVGKSRAVLTCWPPFYYNGWDR